MPVWKVCITVLSVSAAFVLGLGGGAVLTAAFAKYMGVG